MLYHHPCPVNSPTCISTKHVLKDPMAWFKVNNPNPTAWDTSGMLISAPEVDQTNHTYSSLGGVAVSLIDNNTKPFADTEKTRVYDCGAGFGGPVVGVIQHPNNTYSFDIVTATVIKGPYPYYSLYCQFSSQTPLNKGDKISVAGVSIPNFGALIPF